MFIPSAYPIQKPEDQRELFIQAFGLVCHQNEVLEEHVCTKPKLTKEAPPQTMNPSPAALFLASFMSSPAVNREEEERVDEYILDAVIGYGGSASVRLAHHHVDPHEIKAVKIVDYELSHARVERELALWRTLQHPNILTLDKVAVVHNRWYFFSDYCAQGNLYHCIEHGQRVDEHRARSLFRDICHGVRYLHVDRGIVHKDLKLENVLLDDTGRVRICDFGMALDCREEEDMAACGSLAYVAPEQIKHTVSLRCPKTDMWSMGVLLYALVVGSLPFNEGNEFKQRARILEGAYELPHTLSEPLKQVIRGCLAYDPVERWDIDTVLCSSWLS